MAKAKKAKNEEQRVGENSNSEAVVKHQKLCLSIDMDSRRIYGYTEIKIVVPDNGIVGLHADNLEIENVTVEGEPAEFQVFPHYQHLDPRDRWSVVSSTTSAADASGSVYLSSLETELLPNLLIMCSKTPNMDNQQEESIQTDKEEPSSTDACRPMQNVKNVRIDYWVEKAETGVHFDNDVLHTDNQLRRARCWFPCLDDHSQCCCYDLEFTVASNLVAVSSGTLLYQILTNEDPPRKTYVYKLDIPVSAHLISLAVAPFEILADQHVSLLSHFCLPSNLPKLQNTVAFFQNTFSYYEEYLSAPFPFRTYKQVFIFPEMAVSSLSSGASISIFSSHLLFDEKLLDQTIETRIKLAYALARQWFGVYITPEDPTDEWLLDGLAEFLTDSFIKRFLGHNEARYRRYKANHAVCEADDSGTTALSSTLATKDLYGTQSIGFYGRIRSRKSVAILQMLEKQMGPESFRKILQNVVLRARDGSLSLRSLSTKEFRHYANKIGNLERPFLKEFFPRWVGSCGCPVLKMGFSYNKRKNMVELAVLRGCTSRPDSWVGLGNKVLDSEIREGIVGWPGMMSIRVHELDGMYDHPILPMSGEQCLLLEIQCHSKLAAKRFQKPKKSTRTDGSDDNGDAVVTTDARLNSDSPLLWLRADPEIEYLAEVHFNQPMQMWINQLEKDKDVVAQTQAIAVLKAFQQLPSSVINALNNFLSDSKVITHLYTFPGELCSTWAFWRVRIQAAYALATTTCEDTDWAGLHHLINFYKSKRFDPNIGLPRPNDFNDVQEYFVLEAIPLAIAMVRTSDKKSPREAVEFILQLLKYNDNSGNPYSDVFWVSTLVQSVGELEFRDQSIDYLTPLLKRLDRLLQFDRLMPSHNGILTVSCIRSLSQMALKLSKFLPLDNVAELINPYRASKIWQIRVAASRALLELEFHFKGTDATLTLLIKYLKDETSLRGQAKLGVCALRLCQMIDQFDCDNGVKSHTLVALLHLLESPLAFNNTNLRHCIFCILQVLARRDPTLFGVPRDENLRMGHMKTCREVKNFFAAIIKQSKHPLDPEGYAEASTSVENHEPPNAVSTLLDESLIPLTQQIADAPAGDCPEQGNTELDLPEGGVIMPEVGMPVEGQQSMQNSLGDNSIDAEVSRKADTLFTDHQQIEPVLDNSHFSFLTAEAINEPDTVSSGREPKKPKLKIRVRQSAGSSRAEDHGRADSRPGDLDNDNILNRDDLNDADRGANSSVSVEQRNFTETSTGHQNSEDANSCQDVGSRVTASIGSGRPVIHENFVKELQCTADSSKVYVPLPSDDAHTSTPRFDKECQRSEHDLARDDAGVSPGPTGKEKEKKKHREKRKKSHYHDNLERKELKRQKKEKKEKKRKEKEMAKLLAEIPKSKFEFEVSSQEKLSSSVKLEARPVQFLSGGKENLNETRQALVAGQGAVFSARESPKLEISGVNVSRTVLEPTDMDVDVDASGKTTDGNVNPTPSAPSHKIKIKFKNRSIGRQ